MKKETKNVKELIYDLLENGTIHGLARINQSKNFLKIIWILLLLGSSIFCVYTISISIEKYLSFPVIVNIYSIDNMEQEFPSITVCNSESKNNLSFSEMFLNCKFDHDQCTVSDLKPTFIMIYT